ncbi:MAG: hypothetical protein LUG57_10820, partial [Oscillospiraceae bacterium]|nr:hypothetical protein [Oscillospiraceae bacterium]
AIIKKAPFRVPLLPWEGGRFSTLFLWVLIYHFLRRMSSPNLKISADGRAAERSNYYKLITDLLSLFTFDPKVDYNDLHKTIDIMTRLGI